MFKNIFEKPPPLSGKQTQQPGPLVVQGMRPPNNPLPSSNDLHNQFNSKLQQIKEIIGQLKNKRNDQKTFNNTVRNRLAEFTKQLSTVIIPAVRNLKSQIEDLRKKCNQIDKNVEKIQNETEKIIPKIDNAEIEQLLRRIEQLEREKEELLDSQELGELDKQEIQRRLEENQRSLKAAEDQIQEKSDNMEQKTQQQVAQIQQNREEIESLNQQKAQLEEIIANSMNIMDEIIGDLNGLNVADNNDVMNSAIDSIKQNIEELTQLLSENAPSQSSSKGPDNMIQTTSTFANPLQSVPKQDDNMAIRYPVFVSSGWEMGGPPPTDELTIDPDLNFNKLMSLLTKCNLDPCKKTIDQINKIQNPTESKVIDILLYNMISIKYNYSRDVKFEVSIGTAPTMVKIRDFLIDANIIVGGKKRRRGSKKHNKKTKKNNKKTKKQRGGWNYENRRRRRRSRSSRSSRRRIPR